MMYAKPAMVARIVDTTNAVANTSKNSLVLPAPTAGFQYLIISYEANITQNAATSLVRMIPQDSAGSNAMPNFGLRQPDMPSQQIILPEPGILILPTLGFQVQTVASVVNISFTFVVEYYIVESA